MYELKKMLFGDKEEKSPQESKRQYFFCHCFGSLKVTPEKDNLR